MKVTRPFCYTIVLGWILFFWSGVLADKGGPSAEGFAWADSQHVAFEWIRLTSDAANLATPPDNDTVYTYTLPFVFYFYSRPFNQIYISSNGYITFHNYGVNSFPANDNLAQGTSPDSILAVFWDDLQFLNTSDGGVFVDVQGSAPYRKVVIEFRDVVRRANLADGPFEFEVILYETTNIIKFQYLRMGDALTPEEKGASATVGLKFTGTSFFDNLLYSYNQAVLSDSLAIVFYPAGNLSVSSALSPTTMEPAINNQTFTLTFTGLTSTASRLNLMGKADVVRISNPINTTVTDPIYVTEIVVDGQSYYLKKSTSPPSDMGFATWYYNNTVDSLYILLAPFAIRDSIKVVFVEDVPTTAGNYTFNTHVYADLEKSRAATASNSFTVQTTQVARYEFTPATDQTIQAGQNLQYVLTALDPFGNPVPNNDSVNLTAVGSNTAFFNRTNPIPFNGQDTIHFTVSDTVVGDFTVRAEKSTDANIDGESGLITVNPAAPGRLVILSSQSAITVGTSRLLQVALEDAYGNRHRDSLLVFQRLTGNGTFANGLDSAHVKTNAAGIAEVTYTASTTTQHGNDSIRVSWRGTVVDTIIMPLRPGAVSYYSFAPATSQVTTAGSSLNFTITARDVYGNAVDNSDQITLSAVGGTGVTFSPGTTLSFAGGSSVNISVTDTVAESFTVRAEKVTDANINGESGQITVNPATPDHFRILSSQTAITVGESRLLQVALEDRYGNRVKDSLVVFQRIVGSGTFDNALDSAHVKTNSSGIAQADYTASTSTRYGSDRIQVSWQTTVFDTIVLPLQPDAVSYYEFVPATSQTTRAGVTLNFQIIARDIYDNAVSNSDQITLSTINGTGVTFSPGTTIAFAADTVVTISVTDTVTETYYVKAEKSTDANVNGQSGAVTVHPANAAVLEELQGSGNTTVGSEVLLRVRLKDQYQNTLSDSTVKFRRIRGSGTFVNTGVDTIDVLTDANGIAETYYTASQSTALTTDSILVYYGTADSLYMVLTLQPADISYYTIEPSGGVYVYDAGETITLNVTAYDVYDNVVTTSSRQVTLSSNGTGVVFTSANPQNLVNGTATFTAVDTVKESGVTFTVSDGTGKSATSNTFTINPAALAELKIRTAANNGGRAVSLRDTIITADQSLTYYAAGYDRYGNYIADIDSAHWFSSGSLQPVINLTARKLTFDPTTSGVTGKIHLEIAGNATVSGDSTGVVTVNDGALAYLYIQTVPDSGGAQLGDSTIAAGSTLTVYAVGYDSDLNYLGLINSNWTINPSAIGKWANGQAGFTGTSGTMTADSAGNGTIQAVSVDNSSISDESGIITVQAGAADHIVIRTQANGGGQRYDQLNVTITTDTTLYLYAAHYDIRGNFIGDLPVTWAISSTVNRVPSGSRSYIQFDPQVAPDNFIIYTTSATLTNDSTNTITLNVGALDYIVIQDASGSGGTEIDTVTMTAGTPLNLYASGYDAKDNFVSDQSSNWTHIPDTIGVFQTPNPTATNVFEARKSGNTVIEAVTVSGGLLDRTSTITVRPADPAVLTKIASTDSQVASPGTVVPRDLKVRVLDAYNNPVPNIPVTWNPVGGGTVNPTVSTTNYQGYATTTWTLHATTDTDSVKAYLAAYLTNPDTVTFYGFPSSTKADTMIYASVTSDTGAVNSVVGPFRVRVLDSLNNPVNGTKVSFAITSEPDGAVNQSLSADSAFTDASGYAQTSLTLGSKLGTYRVSAFASTTPARLDFTGVADQPDAPNAIRVMAGDAQTDTVGQALPTRVQVKLVDAYENPVSGETIVFEPLNGGSVSPTSAVTDADGLAGTIWTLGTTRGTYFLRARNTAGTIVSDTLTATAVSDAPRRIQLVSIRNIAKDSVTTLPTFATPFSVKVLDQYGNIVGNTGIQFRVASGGNALLTESSATADTNGVVKNSVKIDDSANLTLVQAFIAGVDTLPVHFYRLQYTAASLTPDIARLGTTESFQIQVTNPGPHPVRLDTNASYLTFSDGTLTVTTYLNKTDSIPANITGWTLPLDPVNIPVQLTTGRYTPEIVLRGRGVDDDFRGSLFTDTKELRIFTIDILSTSTAPERIERGNTFDVTMTVRNAGNVTINVDTANTYVFLRNGGQTYVLPSQTLSSVLQVGPDQTVNFQYRLTVPDNFPLGSFYIDGVINGTIVENGQPVADSTADTPDVIQVISAASIAYVSNSLSPSQVTRGLPFAFRLKIQNTGQAEVTLDSTRTFMVFGGDTFYLDQDKVVNGNSTLLLDFESDTVRSSAAVNRYKATLYLYGLEGQATYTDTLTHFDSVRVQNQPSLIYTSFVSDSTQASQGEGGIPLTIVMQNNAALGAPLVIESARDIVIKSADTVYAASVSPLESAYPVVLPAGQSQTFQFQLRFHDTFPVGVQKLWARTTYADSNSSTRFVYEDQTTQIDSIRILKKTTLEMLRVQVVGRDTVSQGQSGVTFDMILRNSGEVSAHVGIDSAYLSFNNQHSLESITPALPVTIAAGVTDTLRFKYTINSQSALGPDPVTGTVIYANTRTGAITTVKKSNADTIYVESAADTNLITINSLDVSQYHVNQGQSGISARVKLTNLAEADARIDSLRIFANQPGVQDSLVSSLGILPGKSSKTYNFVLSIDATADTGIIPLDVRAVFTDLNSSRQYQEVGASRSDSINVLTPAVLVVSPVVVARDTVSQGQQDVDITTFVKNTGMAELQLDAFTPRISPDAAGFSLERISPVDLPRVSGGDSVKFIYRMAVKTTAQTVTDTIDFEARGTDVVDDRTLGPVGSSAPATVVVQSAGSIQIDSVTTPGSIVSIGQKDIPVRVYFRNPGQARVDVSEVTLYFNGSTAGFYQNLDSLQSDPFRGDNVAYLSLEVLSSAAEGDYTVTATVEGTEINKQEAVKDSSTAAQGPTLTVTRPAEMRILAVDASSPTFAFDSVSIGSQNVPVHVRVQNTGSATLLLDTLNVTFSTGNFAGQDSVFTPALQISPGSTHQIDFAVDVLGSNTPGSVTLNARGAGRDANANTRVTDSGADTTDSWRMVSAGKLVYTSISPNEVSNGQTVSFRVEVENEGQADMKLFAASTYLDFAGTRFYLKQDTWIEGNRIKLLDFENKTVQLPTGTIDGQLVVNNYFENGFYKSTTLSPVTITVYDSARVIIQSIAAPDTVSQEQVFSIQVSVVNDGADRAAAMVDSLLIPELNVRDYVGQQAPANTVLVLPSVEASLDTTVQGLYPYTVRVVWRDVNIGNKNYTDSLTQVLVLKKATIDFVQAVAPDTVITGQTVDSVKLTFRNRGEVAALIDQISFDQRIGVYDIQAQHNVQEIPPGRTVDLYYRFRVKDNSATGSDSISVTVRGRDEMSNNGITTQVSPAFDWRIQENPVLTITAVVAAQNSVSRGQTGARVKVNLSNNGGGKVVLDTVRLNFANGNANYGNILKTGLNKTIPGGDTAVVLFHVEVSPSATLGNDVIDAAASGRDAVSGKRIQTGVAQTTDSWTVQQRPILAFTHFAVDKDTASTGQSNVLLNFRVKNNGQNSPTATARIDSIEILVNGTPFDTSNFTIVRLFSLPITLPNGASTSLNYRIEVRPTARSNAYLFTARVHYRDGNDQHALVFEDAGTNDRLQVVQQARLVVESITITPDTAHIGQEDLQYVVRVRNTGEAGGEIFSNTLTFYVSYPFTQTLESPLLPVTVPGGGSRELRYAVDVPNSITLDAYQDTLIYVGTRLTAQDVFSEANLDTMVDSLSFLTVVNPADFQFLELGPYTIFDDGDTVRFTVTVVNAGGSVVHLNQQTHLEIPSEPQMITYIDSLATDMTVAPAETTVLVFQPLVLTQTGEYVPVARIRGTSNQVPYAENLNTVVINIGGNVSITDVQVEPNQVVPGQTDVEVFVRLTNAGPPLKIDEQGTLLDFRYVDNGEILFAPARRVDSLDTLQTTPPGSFETLHWLFDVPDDARVGRVTAKAIVSFNNGTLTKVSLLPDTFLIKSGVILSYQDGSLEPDSIVPGQRVTFSVIIQNSGNTDLIVNPDSSYLQFTDGLRVFRANVEGNITIRGTLTQAPRENTVPFVTDTIPSTFASNLILPIQMVLHGKLPNDQAFEGDTLNGPAELTVLPEALIVVDSIDVLPQVVTRGQSFVEVRYYLSNKGASVARVNLLRSVFVDSAGGDVSDQWVTVFNSHNMPFPIPPGAQVTFVRKYNIQNTAPLGPVFAGMSGNYNDVRKPRDEKVFNSGAVTDRVRIIQFSSVFVNQLALSQIPNPPYVNYGQTAALDVDLVNSGDDTLKQVYLKIFRETQVFIRDTISALLPNRTTRFTYRFVADTVSQSWLFRAVIDSAFSQITGDRVFIGQPVDNTENLVIQRPSVLTLSAQASDSTLSHLQEFTVYYQISTTGESDWSTGEVELILPQNYRLSPQTPNAVQPIDPSRTEGFWKVRALELTSGLSDTLTVTIRQLPLDLNVQQPVGIGVQTVNIPVRTDTSARIVTLLAITEPQGAVDRELTTGQQFLLKNTILFLGQVAGSNRVAEVVVPPGYSVEGSTRIDVTQPGVAQEVLWRINTPATSSGPDTIRVINRGMDENTLEEIVDRAQIVLHVVEGARIRLRATIAAPPGAIDGELSTDQTFHLNIQTQNLGQAGLADTSQNKVVVHLPQGIRFADRATDTLSLYLGIQDTTIVLQTLESALPLRVIRVQLDRVARDENTLEPAAVVNNLVRVPIRVVPKALLQLTTRGDSIMSTGQTGVVTVELRNLGQAKIVPDSVQIQVVGTGKGLSLLGTSGTQYIRVNPETRSGSADFAVLATAVGTDSLAVAIIDTSVRDENHDFANVQAARTADTVYFAYTIQQRGLIVSRLSVESPEGAQDSTVSTGQVFRLKGELEFQGSVAPEDRMVALVFDPASGFRILGDSIRVLPGESDRITVTWELLAPDFVPGAPSVPGIMVPAASERRKMIPEKPLPRGSRPARPNGKQGGTGALTMGEREDALRITGLEKMKPTMVKARSRIFKVMDVLRTVQGTPFFLQAHAIEKNTGEVLSQTSNMLPIQVQRRAVLRLEGVQRAYRLSRKQRFEVAVQIWNSGDAPVKGGGSVGIDLNGMQLAGGETLEKAFHLGSAKSVSVSWRLVAPDSNINALLNITFRQLPEDANSNTLVDVHPDSNRVVVDVNMIPKRLIVEKLAEIVPESNYVQGQEDVAVLGFSLSNPQVDDTLYVRKVFISLRNPGEGNRPYSDIVNMLSRIKVVSMKYYRELLKKPGSGHVPDIFADIPISDTTANPVSLPFNVNEEVLPPGETHEMVVLFDIARNAPNRNFSVGLDGVLAFQKFAGEFFAVEVTDSIGNPIDTLNNKLQSQSISVVPSDPKKSFGNYPNPFGLGKEFTKFVFYLEATADVELRIYTLLGELVWKKVEKGLQKGLYDGKIVWDGRNERGYRVLNGVYLAVLRVKYQNGETKMFKTKVAYIK